MCQGTSSRQIVPLTATNTVTPALARTGPQDLQSIRGSKTAECAVSHIWYGLSRSCRIILCIERSEGCPSLLYSIYGSAGPLLA